MVISLYTCKSSKLYQIIVVLLVKAFYKKITNFDTVAYGVTLNMFKVAPSCQFEPYFYSNTHFSPVSLATVL